MERIEKQLKNLAPELSMHESQVLWSRIDAQLSPRGVKSPMRRGRRSLFRALTAGFVIFGLLGGSVVTAYASEALPGDVLYPTKITFERAQILLALPEKKKDLQLAFADRRVKEVRAVLADIEEESQESPTPTLMAVSEPVPAVFSVEPSPASAPDTEHAVPAAMMKAVPLDDNAGGGADGQDQSPQMKPSAVRALPNRVETPSTSPREVNQVRKWKNIEKKKKALTAVIRELERSRKDLEQSGETETSGKVDAVIVNLTELNSSGTTPDEGFVENIKNHGDDVLKRKKEDGNDTKTGVSDKEEHDSSFLQDTTPNALMGAPVFAVSNEESADAAQELEQVRLKNEERKNRMEQQMQGRKMRTGELNNSKDKRVPVCFMEGGDMHELQVLENNLPRYTARGFLLGTCPPPSLEIMPPVQESEDSHIPQEEERSILGG